MNNSPQQIYPWKESGYAHAHDAWILPIGYRCNFLTVRKFLGSKKSKFIYLCDCECGRQTIQEGSKLRKGRVKGCKKCMPRRIAKRSQATRYATFCIKNKKRIETILSFVGQFPIAQIAKFIKKSERGTAEIIRTFNCGMGNGCPGQPKSIEHRKKISESRLKLWRSKKI